jgi:putative ABC transport system substrate-binding protein
VKRRDFITLLGGAAAWPVAARAQAMPVIGYLSPRSSGESIDDLADFRRGLAETGYIEGRNVAIEYRWADGRYDRLPFLASELVSQPVTVLAALTSLAALAAKEATRVIPIVFAVGGEDPVKLGLVASLPRPGGNATGIYFFFGEVVAKRLQLLHEVLPKAVRVAVLVNPANATGNEGALRDVQEAARGIGLEIQVLSATTIGEIDAAFAALARERPDALFIAPNAFFTSRRAQLATLAAVHKIPASYAVSDFVAAGGLMSYGTNFKDTYRQVGVYTGRILKGAKPAELPVVQSSKFEFAINLRTARALDIEVPPGVLALADEVIE